MQPLASFSETVHLRRDFQAHAEGLAAEKEFGEHGLRICGELSWSWEIYQHTGDRKELKRRIRLVRRQLKPMLRQYSGKAPRYKYTRGLARNLLKLWPALWTFTETPGVEPTNNHAERRFRSAVIYRKLSPAAKATTAKPGSPGCSQRTPPAASNTARSSSTSPKRSPPTPTATPPPPSPEHPNPLNAYKNPCICREFGISARVSYL